MARMYSRKRGKHGSKRPPLKIIPRWVKYKKKDIEELVVKLANEKHSSAAIGIILRDQYGIPDAKIIAGRSISKIVIENKLYPAYPEDLMSLFKKAITLRGHLAKHKGDKHSKKGLEHLESKIRRLIKYYSSEGKVSKDFSYDPEKIKLIVQK